MPKWTALEWDGRNTIGCHRTRIKIGGNAGVYHSSDEIFRYYRAVLAANTPVRYHVVYGASRCSSVTQKEGETCKITFM